MLILIIVATVRCFEVLVVLQLILDKHLFCAKNSTTTFMIFSLIFVATMIMVIIILQMRQGKLSGTNNNF